MISKTNKDQMTPRELKRAKRSAKKWASRLANRIEEKEVYTEKEMREASHRIEETNRQGSFEQRGSSMR